MLRMRILFVWLLMAAIPLQGFAATAMLFCDIGVQHQHQVDAVAPSTSATESQHEHAMHGKASKESSHRCSICATCCNSMAMIAQQQVFSASTTPKSELAEPLVFIQARAASLPDKPPRA
ncbi:MAG: hypothetical protein ABIZ09_03885 [Rhodoferax sp.]